MAAHVIFYQGPTQNLDYRGRKTAIYPFRQLTRDECAACVPHHFAGHYDYIERKIGGGKETKGGAAKVRIIEKKTIADWPRHPRYYRLPTDRRQETARTLTALTEFRPWSWRPTTPAACWARCELTRPVTRVRLFHPAPGLLKETAAYRVADEWQCFVNAEPRDKTPKTWALEKLETWWKFNDRKFAPYKPSHSFDPELTPLWVPRWVREVQPEIRPRQLQWAYIASAVWIGDPLLYGAHGAATLLPPRPDNWVWRRRSNWRSKVSKGDWRRSQKYAEIYSDRMPEDYSRESTGKGFTVPDYDGTVEKLATAIVISRTQQWRTGVAASFGAWRRDKRGRVEFVRRKEVRRPDAAKWKKVRSFTGAPWCTVWIEDWKPGKPEEMRLMIDNHRHFGAWEQDRLRYQRPQRPSASRLKFVVYDVLDKREQKQHAAYVKKVEPSLPEAVRRTRLPKPTMAHLLEPSVQKHFHAHIIEVRAQPNNQEE